MKLLTRDEDYLSTKCTLTAKLAGIKLAVERAQGEAVEATGLALVIAEGKAPISQHLAILRCLADAAPAAKLLGSTALDGAQVDQWLAFTWQNIEVPLQVLLALASSDPAFILSPTDKPSVEAQAKKDIASGLATVEKHLSSRSFVATAGLTVADVSLFVVASQLQGMGLFSAAALPALGKWYAAVASATGSKSTTSPAVPAAPPAPVAAPAPPAAGAAAVAPPAPPATTSTSIGPTGGKWKRNRTRVKELLAQGEGAIGSTVTLKGWVRTSRSAEKGTILFVEITDGSSVKGVQLVLNASSTEGFASIENCGGVGASVSCTGTVVASPAKGQVLEIHASSAVCIGPVYGGDKPGEVGGKNYPMAKKAHSLEYLREKAHLRIRSKMFSSAMRMRNAMAYATNLFFQERGFILTHTPLITGADCEGAGEQFVVTTLLPEHAKGKDVPLDKAGNVDFSKDFFGRRCCMTVSGQLNVETHAHGLSDVYTFGPTFRAENSHTARHLAEFWMIEPEICFAELEDDMALAEDYVKFCTAYALAACPDDLHYFEHEYPAGEKGLRARLENVANSDFARITYTEAVELLQREIAAGKVKFERNPSWGDDLGSEHERYITEQIFKKPTIVTNYPKDIKAFYMKLNPDGKTVAAMDILVPKIGELIGGSQREDNLDVLISRAEASGMKAQDIWWYADMRRYGSVPHAGFGLGFERLVMFVTGLENIRDVIPFPRVPGHADF